MIINLRKGTEEILKNNHELLFFVTTRDKSQDHPKQLVQHRVILRQELIIKYDRCLSMLFLCDSHQEKLLEQSVSDNKSTDEDGFYLNFLSAVQHL
jgi:hypothetical protein